MGQYVHVVMHRDRKTLLFMVPVLAFLLVSTGLYLSSDYLSRAVLPNLQFPSAEIGHEQPSPYSVLPKTTAAPRPSEAIHTLSKPAIGNGTLLTSTIIQSYIDAILEPESTKLERLACPMINETRYTLLKGSAAQVVGKEYFFALNLREALPLLPRLIGSIVQVIQFLGPERCAVSTVEGNSPDGTGDVLKALKPYLDRLNIEYHYSYSQINPKKGNRIEKLAQLRNLAVKPLLDASDGGVSTDTTVLFLNDVAACPEDLLELALQRRNLGADMTCGMDWTYVGPDPTFYDVWVARGINGDSFFEIPENGSWDSAWNLFWNDAETKMRLMAHKPFQVYSCWNGAAAFTAAPLLEGVRFHDSREGHCRQGEPQNFCKDLWAAGYGKIAVVPSVNLEYSNEKGQQIKKLKGYVSDLVPGGDTGDTGIEWAGPPEVVKCIEGWGNQFWKPWEVSRRRMSL